MFKRVARLGGVALMVALTALLITSLALAYSTDFEDVTPGTPVHGLALPGMTFSADEMVGVYPIDDDVSLTLITGNCAMSSDEGGWIEIEFDEPQDFVSFTYSYVDLGEPTAFDTGGSFWQPMVYGELDGEMVYETQIGPGQIVSVGAGVTYYEGTATLNERVDLIAIYAEGPFVIDNIETGMNPVVDPTPEPTDEPTAEPTEEPVPAAPMLCTLGDGSLNALHCGRPVAVFAQSGGFTIYGVDINTGNGSLAEEVTGAMIEAAGVPADSPVVIAQGQNPYNFRPFTLYRLPGGEFQLNTYYWDAKPYIIKWAVGDSVVDVVEW